MESRVHHRQPGKAATNFATHTQPVAHGQRLLLGGVEGEKAQQTGAGAVVQRHQQLATAGDADLAVAHRALHLRHLTLAHIAQLDQAGFVLVTQRQV